MLNMYGHFYMSMKYQDVLRNQHLFMLPDYPLITIYDDNWFVRNDYDVLSLGQRQFLIKFFKKMGFSQPSGRVLAQENVRLHFPRPQSNLAMSAFDQKYLQLDGDNYYFVTPTEFAECLFYDAVNIGEQAALYRIKRLITKCPYNIEWLRDISYSSQIEALTKRTFKELSHFQKRIIEHKFKHKKAL